MIILRIEHTVPDFEFWKKTGFDSDPLDRKASGVISYTISRPIDDPKYVFIDLEFNTINEAEQMLKKLKIMWGEVTERFGWKESPTTRILEAVESQKISQ